MSRRCFAALALFIAALFLGGDPAWAKPRIAVLDFDDKSGADAPGEAIADMLTTELFKTGEFTILERNRIDAVLWEEQRLAYEGYVDDSTGAGMGRLLGVDFLSAGSITRFKTKTSGGAASLPLGGFGGLTLGSHTAYVTLDIRVINTSTGKIMLAACESGAASATIGGITAYGVVFGGGRTSGTQASATYKAVASIVIRIVALKDGVLRTAPDAVFNVIEGDGATAVLDGGEEAGMAVGQYLAVF